MSVLKRFNAAANAWEVVGGMGQPMQPVSFSAGGGGQSFANNTGTKMTFTTEEWDSLGCFDLATSTFRPTVAGTYMVMAANAFDVVSANQANVVIVSIFKNGSLHKTGNYDQFTTDWFGTTVSCLVTMNGTTDYLEVYSAQKTGATISNSTSTAKVYFQAALIPSSQAQNNLPVNLSNATSEYYLNIGETATITYTSATSVPLHVQTDEGVYEVSIVGDYDISNNGGGTVSLLPNNSSATINREVAGYYAGAVGSNFINATDVSGAGLGINDGRILNANMVISTITKNKSIDISMYVCQAGSARYKYDVVVTWKNTTTAWTSLGTFTFPFAQTGKIVVRRII